MDGAHHAFQISDVRFLPLVSAYAHKLGLVEQIDRLLDCDMDVSPGRVVLAMILDALSGRSPLFRLRESFEDKDIELLVGGRHSLAKARRSYAEKGLGSAVRCGDQHGARSHCA
jgi:hypothetical protein